MILSISAAVALAAAQPVNSGFLEIFVSACMNGSAQFEKGAVRSITQKELPPVLRRQYRGWPGARYYEITKPARGYMLIMRDDDRQQRSDFYEICTVAAPGLPYELGFDQVMRLLQPNWRGREPQKKALLEYYDPEAGIVLSGRTHQSEWGSLKLARPTARYRLPAGAHPLMYTEQAPANRDTRK